MSTLLDDDDDESMGGIYENGHWYWDDKLNALVFKTDLTEVKMETEVATAILGAVDFKEDIDLNEQQRFRKRIQRRVTEGNEFVTLQDVKDVVLFTAPSKIVKPLIINLLHLPATERLLRAMIFFCQYYLQISDIMSVRTLELASKVRTPNSDKTEAHYLENLEDLRLLVAKEYANLIRGSGEFAKYHHMGPKKKSRSLYRRESIMFETFIRISIQIIWVALGRKSFSQIELEIHRIFKSPIFNSAEHKLPKNYAKKEVSANERAVLLGHCLRKKQKVNMLSPLMNEVHCNRKIDHRMYGLGILKYPHLSSRLQYMECALSLPENMLFKKDISIGILGLPRSRFDILLREVYAAGTGTGSSSSVNITKTASKIASSSKSSKGASRKSVNTAVAPLLYKDITLPPKGPEEEIGDFPTEAYPRRPCDEVQRKKWILRFLRLAAKYRTRTGSLQTL